MPCAGILFIPIIAWLLDTKGYGFTLGTINLLAVITSALQAIPSLGLQVRPALRLDGKTLKAQVFAVQG
jgi:hypothetical protein